MSTEPAMDATYFEEPEDERLLPATRPTLAVTPEVPASELVARLDVIRDAMTTAMVRDVDYGVIPGTGSKPTLLKPGAEKLGVLFQLDVQIVNEKTWNGDHLTVSSLATVYHITTGARVGFGEGMCSTWEKKYARRQQARSCLECGMEAIIKGKQEYGGGWVCFKKKGGCGAKFRDDDPGIVSQVVGEIENPDLPDSWNTVLKMSEKRARIDAILAVTGASALFTQDMESAVERGDTQGPAREPVRATQRQTGPLPPTTDSALLLALKDTASGLTNQQLRKAFKDAEVTYNAGKPSMVFDYLEPADAEALLACLVATKKALNADLPFDPDAKR
jgi:hypothetical protein